MDLKNKFEKDLICKWKAELHEFSEKFSECAKYNYSDVIEYLEKFVYDLELFYVECNEEDSKTTSAPCPGIDLIDDSNNFEIEVDKLGFGDVNLNGKHLNKIIKINIDSGIKNVQKVTLSFLADKINYKNKE